MNPIGRPGLSAAQKKDLWQRWKVGQSLSEIARALGKHPGSIHGVVKANGGIVPAPKTRAPRSLTSTEREEISRGLAQGESMRMIATRLRRAPSTVSREIERHGGRLKYRAARADARAWLNAQRPKPCLLSTNVELRDAVAQKLADDWSPQQISGWLRGAYIDDDAMRVSAETDLPVALHRGPRRAQTRAGLVPSHGPGIACTTGTFPSQDVGTRHSRDADQRTPRRDRGPCGSGPLEGDLLIGLERSAIGTVVERTTRFTMLVHLPREEGYHHKHTIKNGPALAGYGAITMKDALANSMSTLPEQLARSLTWDRGKEMSAHAQFKVETGIPVFFADPNSPWQRGTNENTNGLLRQYFPKGTDLSRWTSPREQTCPDGPLRRLKPSHTHSTPGPERPSAGRHPPKRSTNIYCCSNKPVLHPPVESGQYTSISFTERLRDAGIDASIGATGDSYDCPGRDDQRSLQDRADQGPRPVAHRRPHRDRHPGMGRLVQPPTPLPTLRRRPTSRAGSRLLPSPRNPATRRVLKPITLRTRRDAIQTSYPPTLRAVAG